MEVHHHAHTARKKWTHYFWEFFMLFLAVTAGFLVENQREHFIEHKREKQFIITMIEDLKSDTIQIMQNIVYRKKRESMCDSLISCLNDYRNKASNNFNFARILAGPKNSPQIIVTFHQLKISGQ